MFDIDLDESEITKASKTYLTKRGRKIAERQEFNEREWED